MITVSLSFKYNENGSLELGINDVITEPSERSDYEITAASLCIAATDTIMAISPNDLSGLFKTELYSRIPMAKSIVFEAVAMAVAEHPDIFSAELKELLLHIAIEVAQEARSKNGKDGDVPIEFRKFFGEK